METLIVVLSCGMDVNTETNSKIVKANDSKSVNKDSVSS